MEILTLEEIKNINDGGYTHKIGGKFTETTGTIKLSSTGKMIMCNKDDTNKILEVVGYRNPFELDIVWLEGSGRE